MSRSMKRSVQSRNRPTKSMKISTKSMSSPLSSSMRDLVREQKTSSDLIEAKGPSLRDSLRV